MASRTADLERERTEKEELRKAFESAKTESDRRIAELESNIVDLGLERKVAEKKSVQLIKDLQTQVAILLQ